MSTELDLKHLRKVAEAATPGEWVQYNPSCGESHISIDNKVAWRSVESATPFADDEVIPHWTDANHMATFDPPIVLAMIEQLEAAEVFIGAVIEFINQRPEYITALRNTRGTDDQTDYYRWTGHAEARRQLAEKFGYTVPHEPGEVATIKEES